MRSRSFLAIAAAVLASCFVACAAPESRLPLEPDPASLRELPAGTLVGAQGTHGGHVWLGIPFAKPPVGVLRWRAPQPPEPWPGMREAVAFGPRCPQFASALESSGKPGERIGYEDCLTLNVYAPRFTPEQVPREGERLPVMFWIHGGGNTIGGSGFYDGSALASRHGVVVVTANYRLGPLGWFRHAALRTADASAADRSGNFGNLDHLRALEWVQENVAAFGGDPGNVTIFGESAGGRDVLALLVSPLSEGLFHRAISQSGGTTQASPAEAEHFRDDPEPGQAYSSNELLLALLLGSGRAADREAAKAQLAGMTPETVATWLRGLSLDALFAVYGEGMWGSSGMIPVPRMFAEGHVLPEGDMHDAFAAGRYRQVPLLLGANRDEQKLFLFGDPQHVRRWLGVVPRLRDAERYEVEAQAMSRTWRANSVDELALRARRVQGPTVFAYRFDWDEEPTVLGADLSRMLGAAHALEIPFVFGHWKLGAQGDRLFTARNEAGRLALSEAMMAYWAEFARSGRPGRGAAGALPEWKPWRADGAEGETLMLLDTPADGGVRMSDEVLTLADVAAELAEAPGPDAAQRCALLEQLTTSWPRIAVEMRDDTREQLACTSPEEAAIASE
jgi:para-nitrobenzyl esterase